MTKYILYLIGILTLFSCSDVNTPRPYGYFRIEMPKKVYKPFTEKDKPFVFELPTYAQVVDLDTIGWFDIRIPELNCEINLTYLKLNKDLDRHISESRTFAYKHSVKADAINETFYSNDKKRVYGVFYEIDGDVASNTQFFLTDSVNHFLRGALYFKCTPNSDSLEPVIKFVDEDIKNIMETFQWK